MRWLRVLAALVWTGGMILGACGAEKSRVISVAEFRDRMQGAWIGQSVGVSYGWPTEFKGKGMLIDEAKMPVWTPETINETFNQDDLYVEMTFLKTLLEKGVGVTSREAGIDFANSAYRLWCANNNARNNLRRGIAAPASSHPDFHRTTDDIDYQIEADFSGILAPGLPQAAVDLGETFGRIMNYGDGLYAGQFVGAMYAEAYFSKDRVQVVENALKAIPAESKYAMMVRDMLTWHAADPKDWTGAWKKAVDKYQATNLLGKVSFPAIDVKINGAMALLGLLYGEGDMMKTAYISTRGGYDSDCNPSSACGVLGTMIGLKEMDPKLHSALDRAKKWEFTDFTWDGLVAASERVTRQLVGKYGGKIEKDASGAEVFTLPVRAVKPSPFYDSKKPGPVPPDVRLTPAERARIRYLPCEKEGVQSVPVKTEKASDPDRRYAPIPLLAVTNVCVEIGLEHPFSVLHISDSHLSRIDSRSDERLATFARERSRNGRELGEHYLNAAFEHAHRKGLKVVHTGDVMEFASAANLEYAGRRFLSEDVIACPGNHEYWDGTSTDAAQLRPNLRPVFGAEASLAVVGGVTFLAFDNASGRVSTEVVAAFERAVAAKRPIVLVCHVPLPHGGGLEKLFPFLKGAFCDSHDGTTAGFINRVRKEPLVRAILCGHLHMSLVVPFSPTANQYVAGALFDGQAREIRFR